MDCTMHTETVIMIACVCWSSIEQDFERLHTRCHWIFGYESDCVSLSLTVRIRFALTTTSVCTCASFELTMLAYLRKDRLWWSKTQKKNTSCDTSDRQRSLPVRHACDNCSLHPLPIPLPFQRQERLGARMECVFPSMRGSVKSTLPSG